MPWLYVDMDLPKVDKSASYTGEDFVGPEVDLANVIELLKFGVQVQAADR